MRKSTLVLGAAVTASAASSLWLWSQWRDELAVNLELRARVEALARGDQHTPAAAPVITSSQPTAVRASSGVADAPAAVRAPAPMANYPRVQQQLLKNPRFRQALRSQQRVLLETEFRDLPKFLNLSPADADRLFDLLAEQGVSLLELQWRGPSSPKEGLSRQDVYRELRKQNEAELSEVLGAANMNRYQEFRSTLQSRAEVDSVRHEMALGPEPLREDQVEPMILLVNSELQRMDQEVRDLGLSPAADIAADQVPAAKRAELAIAANQRIVDAARPILTSVQVAALKELYRRQGLQMEAQTELNRLRAEAAVSNSNTAAPN